ncbi:hypothetical protein [Rossellomorea vietnamensis]|uniref:hypothetical protein n=1 Tax=Rossellomorea vietnamensis TaxID=218284 RepID=UPI001E36454F|nr:hypothetical protein [Rossellomorea vietnamensis]MCC5803223.1 hypothetical protein [Rossellomorea vietnamensis]
MKENQSIIFTLWERIFHYLRYISLFEWLRSAAGKWSFLSFVKTYTFVDLWVLFHFLFSFSAILIIKYTSYPPLHVGLVVYGSLRILEIFVYQMNVLLFDEYRTEVKGRAYLLKSVRRMILLLLHNFIEIIFWFGSTYIFFTHNFSVDLREVSTMEIIYLSFIRMTNFGSSSLNYTSGFGLQLMWFQSIIGLFMTLIVLARFLGTLPSPRTKEEK